MPGSSNFWDNLAAMYQSIQAPAISQVSQGGGVDYAPSPQIDPYGAYGPPEVPSDPYGGGYGQQVAEPVMSSYGPAAEPQTDPYGGYGQADAVPGTGNQTGTSWVASQADNPWTRAGKGFLGSLVPAAGAAATGMLINKMFPGTQGKARALDLRQPEMQRGSQMALSRLQNLERNPNSFGLPGDPDDPNTPAGQRLIQLRRNQRAASAARGGLETGGHEVREREAVNDAIINSYNQVQNQGFQNLGAMSPQLQLDKEPGRPSPWGTILTRALAPAVKTGLEKWFV